MEYSALRTFQNGFARTSWMPCGHHVLASRSNRRRGSIVIPTLTKVSVRTAYTQPGSARGMPHMRGSILRRCVSVTRSLHGAMLQHYIQRADSPLATSRRLVAPPMCGHAILADVDDAGFDRPNSDGTVRT